MVRGGNCTPYKINRLTLRNDRTARIILLWLHTILHLVQPSLGAMRDCSHRSEAEICPRLQYYAAGGADSMPTFRDNLFAPSSRRKLRGP